MDDERVAGYDVSPAVLSASTGDHQVPTLRVFAMGVLISVMGLRVRDVTASNDDGQRRDKIADDGLAEVSNAGAQQLAFPMIKYTECPSAAEVSEGEVDLLEWYLLNHPRPGVGNAGREEKRATRRLGTSDQRTPRRAIQAIVDFLTWT
jgi:hypothetical protein